MGEPIEPPSFGLGIGAGRIPEEPEPNEPTVDGIGTGLVPNCLEEMFTTNVHHLAV
jgi:hypothetical protein